jgi:hypothetical protein
MIIHSLFRAIFTDRRYLLQDRPCSSRLFRPLEPLELGCRNRLLRQFDVVHVRGANTRSAVATRRPSRRKDYKLT